MKTRIPPLLNNAFQQQAGHLFHEKAQPGLDFIHRTVEDLSGFARSCKEKIKSTQRNTGVINPLFALVRF
ncbi:MAG: hypothetical protein GY762_18035 [Proteobacteria bacterium]|nr:hypothetical protein [Pseudomonadota bacterium]